MKFIGPLPSVWIDALAIRSKKKPFKAGGAVVRCEKSKAGGHLVAVFFTQMDAANSRVLSDFISEQAR